jgi:tetratricopeptide (TPR) repeat protein
LAQATDREADPDRRAWHLAAAAPGPDEEVAVELERSAGRAQARGGLAAAAAFLERAVALTPDPSRRSERALAAAQASVQAGSFDAGRGLLAAAAAETGTLDEFQRARVELLRGQVALASGRWGDTSRLLLEAAGRFELLDADLARDTYLEAWGAALVAGRLATGASVLDVSRAARAAPRGANPPRPSDLLLDGFSLLITEGRTAAAPTLARAVAAFASDEISTPESLRWGWMAATAPNLLWDHEGRRAIARRHVWLAREAGLLAMLPINLHSEGMCAALGGEFPTTKALIAEADAVAELTDARVAPYATMLLGALEGRDAEAAAELITSAVEKAAADGQGIGVQYAQYAAAILYNGLSRYDEALAAAQTGVRGHHGTLCL